MSPTYVDQGDGRYLVTGTRVSLDSIVYGFLSGQSAESLDPDHWRHLVS